jgi:hypothetical protein
MPRTGPIRTVPFRLCGRCTGIFEVGPRRYRRQRCRCEDQEDERWPGFDVNERVTLCRCCAAEVLHSGSRWSVWFCPDCLERIKALHDRLGGTLIPIGRHSMMNRLVLRGYEVASTAVDRFAEALVDLFERIQHLEEWHRRRASANLKALGMSELPSVPLGKYLRKAAALRGGGRLTREAAFSGLLDHFREEGRSA